MTPPEDSTVPESAVYRAPTIERLGTLAELTLGDDLPDMGDGFGGAGDVGVTSF